MTSPSRIRIVKLIGQPYWWRESEHTSFFTMCQIILCEMRTIFDCFVWIDGIKHLGDCEFLPQRLVKRLFNISLLIACQTIDDLLWILRHGNVLKTDRKKWYNCLVLQANLNSKFWRWYYNSLNLFINISNLLIYKLKVSSLGWNDFDDDSSYLISWKQPL